MHAESNAQNRTDLMNGLISGFIDQRENALEIFKPRLLTHDINRGQKVLTSIVKELQLCQEFYSSVAFVTESGVVVLQQILGSLMEKRIKGKIVASQYLNFTEPKALRQLLCFPNIELRILTDQKL